MAAMSWNDLPGLVISKVFGYLENRGKFNASLVCKNWSQAFNTPGFWRTIQVTNLDEITVQRTLKMAEKVVAWVREVKIDIGILSERKEFDLIRILDSLQKARLKTFELKNLVLDIIKDEHGPQLTRTELSSSINRLIGTQTSLESFVMTDTRVPFNLGIQILETLSQVSGKTLKHFDIFYICDEWPRRVCSVPAFRSILARFTQLRSVKIYFNCLDDEILLGLAQQCAGILQELALECVSDGPFDDTISSTTWEQVHRLCPNLAVSMDMYLYNDTAVAEPFFSQGMRLREISAEHADQAPCIVQQLHYFTDTLEHLDLVLYCDDDTIPGKMVNLVTACRNLKVLRYEGGMLEHHVVAFCEAQKDGRLRLERCDLAVISNEDGMPRTLDRIRELYAPLFVSLVIRATFGPY